MANKLRASHIIVESATERFKIVSLYTPARPDTIPGLDPLSAIPSMTLRYPIADPPRPGTLKVIAPGVKWLRVPLPMQLDHINLYLLEDHDGWFIVDTGMDTPETENYWRMVFANELHGKPVKGVIVTHLHPDHIGKAAWLTEYWQAPLYMSVREHAAVEDFLHLRDRRLTPDEERFYLEAGATEQQLAYIAEIFTKHKSFAVPELDVVIRGGDTLSIGGRNWQLMEGRGHSPEHICLYCQELELLLSGDHILPNISPNISVWAGKPDQNPLLDYLETLIPFKHLPAATLVLPAHNMPFYGIAERITELIDHHLAHLANIEQACATPKTIIELLPVLFSRELTGIHYVVGICECAAHINYLLHTHRLCAERHGNGALYYRTVSA